MAGPVQAEGGKLTGRRLIVDTGSIFSSLPHWSATGPKLEDPACAAISCWGDIPAQPKFAGQLFEWRFLQVAVKSPIFLGVDFLKNLTQPTPARHSREQTTDSPPITRTSCPTVAVVMGFSTQRSSAASGKQGGGAAIGRTPPLAFQRLL
jgi:hypothetical protein